MISYIIYSSIALVVILSLLGFFFFYIKPKYREYDRMETLKETLEEKKVLIKGAMQYFYDTYNNEFDHVIYETLRIKTNFIKDLINKRGLEKQLYYYNKLYSMLYETEYRIRTNHDNVQAIIYPLKTLIEELVQEQIEFIKENSEGL